tara:strand:- start:691 stop:1509 length:819 start_codon:yes stop_codon:yes gene_type:complete
LGAVSLEGRVFFPSLWGGEGLAVLEKLGEDYALVTEPETVALVDAAYQAQEGQAPPSAPQLKIQVGPEEAREELRVELGFVGEGGLELLLVRDPQGEPLFLRVEADHCYPIADPEEAQRVRARLDQGLLIPLSSPLMILATTGGSLPPLRIGFVSSEGGLARVLGSVEHERERLLVVEALGPLPDVRRGDARQSAAVDQATRLAVLNRLLSERPDWATLPASEDLGGHLEISALEAGPSGVILVRGALSDGRQVSGHVVDGLFSEGSLAESE